MDAMKPALAISFSAFLWQDVRSLNEARGKPMVQTSDTPCRMPETQECWNAKTLFLLTWMCYTGHVYLAIHSSCSVAHV